MSTVVRTMCPMNCHPTFCGMLVEIEDGRVLSVKGDPDNPDSQGFLCVRGQASREIIGNSERLLHPMVRNRRGGGDWRRAGWDEVLDRIAERMREAGRLAVATWTGHGGAAHNYGMRLTGNLVRRFANLYGCQTWGSQMICWGLGGFGLGLTGVLETSTKEDMGAHADLIVPLGGQPGQPAEHGTPRDRRAPARRPGRHRRCARDRGGCAVRRGRRAPSGNGRGAGPGDDARDRARGSARPHVRRAARAWLRRAGGPRSEG